MACFSIPSLMSSQQHPPRAGRGKERVAQCSETPMHNYLLYKETDFLRPKYFKLSHTKAKKKKKKLAMPQVGGNICLTRCNIYIHSKPLPKATTYSSKQPHKHINICTKRMTKLKIHQLYPITSVPHGHEVCNLHRCHGYSNTLHNLQLWKRASS